MWAPLAQAAGAAAGYLKLHGTAISVAAALGMGGARYADQQVLDEAGHTIHVLTQHIATSEDGHSQQRGQLLSLTLQAQQENVRTLQQRDDAQQELVVTRDERDCARRERDVAQQEAYNNGARNEQLWKQTTGNGIKRDLLNEWKRCTIGLDQLRILAFGYTMKRREDVTSDAGILERYPNVETELLNVVTMLSRADAPEALVQGLILFQQLQQSEEDAAFIREFRRMCCNTPPTLQESRILYGQYQALTAQLQAVEE